MGGAKTCGTLQSQSRLIATQSFQVQNLKTSQEDITKTIDPVIERKRVQLSPITI